jgi:hypothetical protein
VTRSHPWDQARTQRLYRMPGYPWPTKKQKLDRGVNYFVLALEQAGATPRFSCEGHPLGFYVTFHADYALAQKIASAGFLDIAISRSGGWRASFPTEGAWKNEREKRRTLRWTAETWERVLGPLRYPMPVKEPARGLV